MIIRREALQAVLPAICKDDAAHRCDKLQITTKGEIAATDGHILLVATEAHRFPDEDFPVIKDVPARHGDPAESVTVDRGLVERLLKALPKKQQTIPILGCAQLSKNGDGHYLAATDLVVPTIIRLEPQEKQIGGFPTWERVMPRAETPHLAITLSGENLKALAAAAAAIDPKHEFGGRVTLFIPTEPQMQGVDKAKAIEAGCYMKRNKYGEELFDPQTEQPAASRDYPNGAIESAIRVELDGRDVQVMGAVAPFRRTK